ncbi:MAG: NAD-dependent epimerase/dehydratase family protein [Thermoproteota archaeon]
MRILITGGAGFIGHNLAIYLKNSGFEVGVLDSLERSTVFAVKRLSEANIPVARMSVIKTEEIKGFFKEADVVIHAAAYVDVVESMEKPSIYFENNVLGTVSVAKASLDVGVDLLIYLSSAAVYGDPVELPIGENHPTRPISPYGLSKLMGEEVVEFFSKYGLKQVVLRLFNVYGPGQNAAYAGVITKFLERVRNGLPPIVYGDGEQTRDFIHVEDVAEAVKLVLKTGCVGEVLNIGSGNPIKIRDLAALVMRTYGVSGEPIYTIGRQGDIKHSYADISRARILLGFKPRINLENGLKRLLEGNY